MSVVVESYMHKMAKELLYKEIEEKSGFEYKLSNGTIGFETLISREDYRDECVLMEFPTIDGTYPDECGCTQQIIPYDCKNCKWNGISACEGKNILMTGDGLNDAGAFMQSDVALSIADDIYHFSPAGDAIIEASKFNKLNRFIKYAQKAQVIVKIGFLISFQYNIVGLSFAITGNLSPVVAAILMPISSITVVAFATFSTRLLARKYF